MKCISRWLWALVVMLVGSGVVRADWISLGTNSVNFAPSELVTPVATAGVAAAVAAAVLIILGVGVRWCYKLVKGSR